MSADFPFGPSNGYYIAQTFGQNDAVTDNNVGKEGWQITTIGNASTLAYQTIGKYGTALRTTTAATADGDGAALHSFPDGLVVTPLTWFKARLQYPVELASGNFRVGFDDSVTATRPTVGVTIESDAGVLTCRVDSANGDNSKAVTGHPDLTSGTTAVVGEWLDFEVRCSGKANANGGPDEVSYFVNGFHVATLGTLIGSGEEVEAKVAHWQDSGGTDAVALDIAYFEAFIPRPTYPRDY